MANQMGTSRGLITLYLEGLDAADVSAKPGQYRKSFYLEGTTPHAECGAVLARSTKEKREMPHVPQIQTSPFLAT